jgi:hypothetical protein
MTVAAASARVWAVASNVAKGGLRFTVFPIVTI